MKPRHLISTVLRLALAGCSESETKTPTSSSGTSGAPDTPPSRGETPGEGTGPAAPKLDQLMKMSGALHVMWTNPTEGCDSIEGERKATKADGAVHEEYNVVFTEPGEADNKHDMGATEDVDYTYRLRCKKGDAYSKYSNEMTQNPMK